MTSEEHRRLQLELGKQGQQRIQEWWNSDHRKREEAKEERRKNAMWARRARNRPPS